MTAADGRRRRSSRRRSRRGSSRWSAASGSCRWQSRRWRRSARCSSRCSASTSSGSTAWASERARSRRSGTGCATSRHSSSARASSSRTAAGRLRWATGRSRPRPSRLRSRRRASSRRWRGRASRPSRERAARSARGARAGDAGDALDPAADRRRVVVEAARLAARSRLARRSQRLYTSAVRGVSSAGRAPPLQGGGHRFDPDTLHIRFARFAFRSLLWVGCGAVGQWAGRYHCSRPTRWAPRRTHRSARFTGETSFPRGPPSVPCSRQAASLLSPNKLGSATAQSDRSQ